MRAGTDEPVAFETDVASVDLLMMPQILSMKTL